MDFHYITPEYNNTAKQEKELEQKLDQVLASLNLSGMTDYQKIEAIYRYVCENVAYSEQVLNSNADPLNPSDELRVYYSAYGALVLKSTTCQGFSSLIYRMMLKAGIDCRLIAGDDHGWNMVKLNGKYYYLDATWDSALAHNGAPLKYFLKGSAKFRTSGVIESGGSSETEHKAWSKQFTKTFLDQYNISVLDYGETDLSTGGSATIGSGKCGDTANWTLTADGKLTITGTGNIWDAPGGSVWHTGEGMKLRWDGLNGYIKKVEIGQGITRIGQRAFMNCPQLTAVSFASSVETIGEYAFAMCEKLPQITLPNTVKTLQSNAFYQCVRLESASLSSKMEKVPENAFIGCTALKTVQIPNGIKEIERSAFAVCTGLQGLQLPASVTTLGPMAFAQSFDPAKKISLTIPETVTKIHGQCFAETGLYKVDLKAKVTTLDYYMFNYCHYLQSVTLSDTIKSFTENTFYECTNLKEVKLPSALEDLGENAFVCCMSLQNIDLPNTLKKISMHAFSDCVSLKTVTLPNALEVIDDGAFSTCKSLEEVSIPASLKQLGSGAFFECGALRSVKFQGNAPSEIGSNPFAFVTEVNIYYPKGNATWNQSVKDQMAMGNLNVTYTPAHGPNDPHTPGTWKASSDVHVQTCADCGAIMQTQAHNWNAGEITQQPNCKNNGTKTYTCTTCFATKAESIPKNGEHVYANPCDGDCNLCGATRSVSHIYATDWSFNEQGHFHSCTKCGGQKDYTAHTPGAAATDTTPQLCTVCGWVIAPAINHTHEKFGEPFYDDTHHWYACNGCNEQVDLSAHIWQNDCDHDCEACDYTRDINHDYDGRWEADRENHWLICGNCGELLDHSPHDWIDGVCGICRVSEDLQESVESGDYLWIAVAAVALISTTVLVVILEKKKKQ